MEGSNENVTLLSREEKLGKIVNRALEAVADIPDGAKIMIGGWGYAGIPQNLILALRDHGAKDLTIYVNGTGTQRLVDTNILVKNKQLKRIKTSIVFPGTPVDVANRAGEIEIELVPQGTLAEAIRAGGAGIGGFYTPTGVGTPIAAEKETRIINGKEYILELPLRADYALVRAYKADRFGNLIYKGMMRNFNVVMATAADITIAEVEEIVEELDPEIVVTPQLFVDRIVKIPEGRRI